MKELFREIVETFRAIWSLSPEGREYLAKCDAALRELEELKRKIVELENAK